MVLGPLVHQESEEPGEPGQYGCPMLVPVQWEYAAELRVPTSRCLIGWSVGDRLAVARCRATPAVVDCWKQHPERTPAVALDPQADPEEPLHRAAAD